MKKNSLIYHLAKEADAISLMRLYQISHSQIEQDDLFASHEGLIQALESQDKLWVVAEKGKEVAACLLILLDRAQGLSKIHRLFWDCPLKNSQEMFQSLLDFAMSYIESNFPVIDVLYATTRSLGFREIQNTLDMGYKLLGLFPKATGLDSPFPQTLSAYYFKDTLRAKRYAPQVLHPVVGPFYDILSRELGLPPLKVLEEMPQATASFEPMPPLEIIRAPQFVAERFRRLSRKRVLSMSFYPFQEPNAVLTDPEQRIEVFVRIEPKIGFATVIGEHLSLSVNPVELYKEISRQLYEKHVGYIETINDSGDILGIEMMVQAGYYPCAYFPCLKRQGDIRRDFVVFARAFEDYRCPLERLNQTMQNYLQAYESVRQRRFRVEMTR